MSKFSDTYPTFEIRKEHIEDENIYNELNLLIYNLEEFRKNVAAKLQELEGRIETLEGS